ncbi:LuxR C-terminal-related transcriptional regulator [Microbacterium sp.]|uniref:LuxR C-terminal-related transcriptional regulator n=1 Tax=Microbacterium sp. TaxID=51671 RepID=UPI003A83E166
MTDLGPSERELEAYGEIVDAGALDARGLSVRLGMEIDEVHDVLRRLRRSGLVYPDESGGFVAAPPNVALRGVVEAAHALGARWLADVSDLDRRYRRRGSNEDVGDTVEVVVGRQAVVDRANQMFSRAMKTIRSLAGEEDIAIVPADGYPTLTAAVERGVQNDVVVPDGALVAPGGLIEVLGRLSPRIELRAIDRIPVRIVIIDNAIVMLPLPPGPDGSTRLMFLQNSPIVVTGIALFDYVWRAARPFRLDSDRRVRVEDQLDQTESLILSMLLAGATDGAVAAELGLSERTVQRRTRDLMYKLGAASRIQLGYEAGRRGMRSA